MKIPGPDHPITITAAARTWRARFNGQMIADSSQARAAYFTVTVDGKVAPNVIWSYETPFPAMAGISGHLAFYADRVDVYEVDDAVR